jgi:hypothetical protein|nr:MAG TPA: type I neck protein [Caudoviricetes sp.]
MASSKIKVQFDGLKAFQRVIEEMEKEKEQLMIDTIKELAGRLLRKVIKRTPVSSPNFGIATYKRDNKKKGIKKGDTIYDKKGRARVLKTKTVSYKKDGKTISKTYGGQGGTLRKNWTVSDVRKNGENYEIEVSNSTEYASYVEYGHRQAPGRFVPAIGKRLKKSWVKGKFMLTISESELQKQAPAVIEKKITEWLKKLGG